MEGQKPFISSYELKLLSKEARLKEGDCLAEDYISVLLEKVHLILKQNDIANSLNVWKQLSKESRENFHQKYGSLIFLFMVTVDENLIRAMFQFWDPSYRCFVFNEVDMVPTIEEYSTLLCLKPSNRDKIYLKNKTGYRKKMVNLLGMSLAEVDAFMKIKGESTCIPWSFLRSFIMAHLDDELGVKAMALAIYGLVIFPRALGYMEIVVVDLIDQLEHGINPAPAILAETIHSLNHCRRTGEGHFQGCMQLLYIWMKSHFECVESCFEKIFIRSRIPISEFCKSKRPKPKSKRNWISFLHKLKSQEVVWRAPWMAHELVLYSCGDKPWVPFLGLWGAVSYAPILVRRQVGSEQFVPMRHGLIQLEFAYTESGTLKKAKEIAKAWKRTVRIEPERYTNDVAPEFSVWHLKHGKDVKLSLDNNEDDLVQPTPRDPMLELEKAKRKLQMEKDELERENKRLRQEMEERSKQWSLKIQEERSEWKALLKDANSTLSSTITELGKIQKENEELQKKIQQMTLEHESLKEGNVQVQVRRMEKALQQTTNNLHALAKECEKWRNGYYLKLDHLKHLFVQINLAIGKAREMEDRVRVLKTGVNPATNHGYRLSGFLDEVHDHYPQIMNFLKMPKSKGKPRA